MSCRRTPAEIEAGRLAVADIERRIAETTDESRKRALAKRLAVLKGIAAPTRQRAH